MSRYEVVVTATAQAHIRAVVRWCVENDRGIPEIFLDELDAVVVRLAVLPHSGHVYRESPVTGMYRILLRRSAHHVYYLVDDHSREVQVRAVWYTGRGRGPEL